jgi:hypothetical protein
MDDLGFKLKSVIAICVDIAWPAQSLFICGPWQHDNA